MPTVNDIIVHCQKQIKKDPPPQKLLHYLSRLDRLRVTVQDLMDTGVGRTVNTLSRLDGEVARVATNLVNKWKAMVSDDNSDTEEESQTSDSSMDSADEEEDGLLATKNADLSQYDDTYNDEDSDDDRLQIADEGLQREIKQEVSRSPEFPERGEEEELLPGGSYDDSKLHSYNNYVDDRNGKCIDPIKEERLSESDDSSTIDDTFTQPLQSKRHNGTSSFSEKKKALNGDHSTHHLSKQMKESSKDVDSEGSPGYDDNLTQLLPQSHKPGRDKSISNGMDNKRSESHHRKQTTYGTEEKQTDDLRDPGSSSNEDEASQMFTQPIRPNHNHKRSSHSHSKHREVAEFKDSSPKSIKQEINFDDEFEESEDFLNEIATQPIAGKHQNSSRHEKKSEDADHARRKHNSMGQPENPDEKEHQRRRDHKKHKHESTSPSKKHKRDKEKNSEAARSSKDKHNERERSKSKESKHKENHKHGKDKDSSKKQSNRESRREEKEDKSKKDRHSHSSSHRKNKHEDRESSVDKNNHSHDSNSDRKRKSDGTSKASDTRSSSPAHKKSKREPPPPTKKRSIHIDEEINSESGVRFEELLGCLDKSFVKVDKHRDKAHKSSGSKDEVTKLVRRDDTRKSSDKKHKAVSSIIEPTLNISPHYTPSKPSSSLTRLLPLGRPLVNELSSLEICDPGNYWEDHRIPGRHNEQNAEDTLSSMMASRTQRTKVFSGKSVGYKGNVPRLFDMCMQVLQDNIAYLTYTGGVPYDILKPALERATAQQLFQIEEYNPYLLDEGATDELWRFHCNREFKCRARDEFETWRDLYERCITERDRKFADVRKKMLHQFEVAAPVRKAKLAYVEPVGGPKFNKSKATTIKHGMKTLKTKEEKGPKRGVGTSASVGFNNPTESSKIVEEQAVIIGPDSRAAHSSAPSSSRGGGEAVVRSKPRKAPLMAKTMKFIKTLQRR